MVSYSVTANSTANTRTGTMTIAGQTFTVTQEPEGFATLTLKITGNGSETVAASTGTLNCRSDGKADILWQNTETGDVAVWLMDGVNIFDNGYVVMGMPSEWQAK